MICHCECLKRILESSWLLAAFEASESRAASELGLTVTLRLQVLTLEVPQWGRTPTGEFLDTGTGSATGSCIFFGQWNLKSGATTGPGLKLPCLSGSFKLKLNFKFKLPLGATVTVSDRLRLSRGSSPSLRLIRV